MEEVIKLSEWAKRNAYSYRGAYQKYHREGIDGAFQNDTGRIFVRITPTNEVKRYVVTYSRVSSHKQKEDLERQSERLRNFCTSSGIKLRGEYKEIASGLNDERKVLDKIFSNEKITDIVVEHKDRLTRFGFNYLDKFSGKNIIVVNEAHEEKEDLMQDLISIITSMTARYYGRRRSGRVKEKIISLVGEKDS